MGRGNSTGKRFHGNNGKNKKPVLPKRRHIEEELSYFRCCEGECQDPFSGLNYDEAILEFEEIDRLSRKYEISLSDAAYVLDKNKDTDAEQIIKYCKNEELPIREISDIADEFKHLGVRERIAYAEQTYYMMQSGFDKKESIYATKMLGEHAGIACIISKRLEEKGDPGHSLRSVVNALSKCSDEERNEICFGVVVDVLLERYFSFKTMHESTKQPEECCLSALSVEEKKRLGIDDKEKDGGTTLQALFEYATTKADKRH